MKQTIKIIIAIVAVLSIIMLMPQSTAHVAEIAHAETSQDDHSDAIAIEMIHSSSSTASTSLAAEMSATEDVSATIDQLISQAAETYGVARWILDAVISCENAPRDPDLQSRHIYHFTDAARGIFKGDQEKSFGLVQISLPHHPTISHAQATDPEFSINFLAKHVAAGHGDWWTCYRKIMYY